jgi:hypothetical protein
VPNFTWRLSVIKPKIWPKSTSLSFWKKDLSWKGRRLNRTDSDNSVQQRTCTYSNRRL